MPHTNTIEALTLELDRVNEQKRELLEILNKLTNYTGGSTNALLDPYLMERVYKAIKKAESR